MRPLDASQIRALSRCSSPDPFPLSGGEDRDTAWLYARGEYERLLLERMVAEALAAGRTVHYAQNFARPAAAVRFRRLSTGEIITRADGEMPALSTGAAAAVGKSDPEPLDWEADAGDGWHPVQLRWGTHVPPHLLDEPVHVITPKEIAPGLFDVGATVLGHVTCTADAPAGAPSLRTGESRAEALSETEPETRHDLVRDDLVRDDARWRTVHRQGFRYVRSEGAQHLRVEASIRPIASPGAFVCSDDGLSRTWAVAAYTTRVCQQRLSLDGIKRDRLPWAGDQALSLLADSFVLGDAEIAADTLTALGRPRDGYVNGLADYSLWWVIAQREMLRRFGERGAGPAGRGPQADAVDAFLTRLARDVDEDGVLRPRDLGSFPGAGPVLIDWGVDARPGEELTALQILHAWALTEAVSLLADAHHPRTAHWAEQRERALVALWEHGWDIEAGAWREHLGGRSTSSAYPNLLAVLAGLHGTAVPVGVVDRIDVTRVRTPFMAGFALLALHRAGRSGEALQGLRDRWMPMIAAGATTFWEEFPDSGDSPYEMYGRPFGKSLCHGWGAAPAALLPEIVLGVRPLDDGWRTVRVDPRLNGLEWACAVVPTPSGDLVVTAEHGALHVEAPPGVRVVGPDGGSASPAGASLPSRSAKES